MLKNEVGQNRPSYTFRSNLIMRNKRNKTRIRKTSLTLLIHPNPLPTMPLLIRSIKNATISTSAARYCSLVPLAVVLRIINLLQLVLTCQSGTMLRRPLDRSRMARSGTSITAHPCMHVYHAMPCPPYSSQILNFGERNQDLGKMVASIGLAVESTLVVCLVLVVLEGR